MECPYCHKDMMKGRIQTKGEVIKWIPANKSVQLVETRWTVKKGEIKLGSYSFFTGGSTEAYCCQECHKILIDYNGEE